MNTRIGITALLLLVLITDGASAQEKYTLTYRFEKGRTYLFKESGKGMMTQEAMGQEMKIPMDLNGVNRFVVEDVASDGSISITHSYDSYFMSIKSDVIDTVGSLDAVIGKRRRTVINPHGTLIRTEVIDSMDTPGAGNMLPTTGFLPTLPEKPVAIGETWSAVKTDANPALGKEGTMKTSLTYTLVGVEKRDGRDALKITYTGTTEMSGTGSQMGMEFGMEGAGTVTGTVWYDPSSGLPLEDDNAMEISTVVSITMQEPMTITGSQTMNTTRVLMPAN